MGWEFFFFHATQWQAITAASLHVVELKAILFFSVGKKLNKLITKLSTQSALILFEIVVHATDAVRPSNKKTCFSSGFLYKRERAGGFFCYLLFPIACFLYTLLPSPRDTLELLGQILIKRNIRYWLNTSLFNFDTHKGLTVKIYIILVCTQQQWALQVTPVGFCS